MRGGILRIIYATILIVFLLAVLLPGCAGRAGERSAEVTENTPVRIEWEDGRKLAEAFVRGDAGAFTALLPEELRKRFGKAEFDRARGELSRTLGEPVSCCFETTLEHPLVGVSLWRIRFERRGTGGEVIHQEALFRVISGRADGRPAIISFNFL